MNLFIFKKSKDESEFKTIITNEYIPISKEDIEFKWEESEGSWDGTVHKNFGYIPYINGIKQNIFEHKMGTSKMIFASLTCDDCSKRLYPKYFDHFGLTKPIN